MIQPRNAAAERLDIEKHPDIVSILLIEITYHVLCIFLYFFAVRSYRYALELCHIDGMN
jgi:hypothetical protein